MPCYGCSTNSYVRRVHTKIVIGLDEFKGLADKVDGLRDAIPGQCPADATERCDDIKDLLINHLIKDQWCGCGFNREQCDD